jgi:rod shape-determining protein MreD
MRWVVFLVAAVICVVLDVSFLDGLAPDAGRLIRPSLTAVLAVFLALSAPRMTALWACFVLGLLLDLSYPVTHEGRVLYLVGPFTLGYVAGAWLTIRTRPVLFRQRALTIGVVATVFVVVVNVVAVVLYLLRSLHPSGGVSWTDASIARTVGVRLLAAVYTGLVAIPAGWLLVKTVPLWGFQSTGVFGGRREL